MKAIAEQIWDMKYRLHGADGTPLDLTVEDSWARVAKALAEAEAPEAREAWETRFRTAMEGYRFLPAGRILAGAGTGRDVTLFNCFVMGEIPDTMEGIFENLKEAALTMQQGGGIGYDFSTLRPKGAPVMGVGADASGPLSFMDVWDAMCRTIMSAGSRRGAMMATMRCDHPDIEAFIEAKQEPGRLTMFNLSVLATDPFMEAVKRDGDWELTFGGRVYKTFKARALWDRIIAATYAWAEPGVIFIDRINKRNNLYYAEEIHATNPCVTADTWVMTAEGPRQVSDLIGIPFHARIDGADWKSSERGFFPTGRKPVLELETGDGHALKLTADHPVLKVARKTRWSLETEWADAGTLRPGDEIMLHDHAATGWPGRGTQAEGYLLGLLVGDGTLKTDKAVLSVWRPARAINGPEPDDGIAAVMHAAETAARTLPHRSDFQGWMEIRGRNEWRLASGALRRLAIDMGLRPQGKTITPQIEKTSSAFHSGFLRGLFDADGSVQGAQTKGVSIRLAASDRDMLRAAQRMLGHLGIASRIYTERRPAGPRMLPDGKGGRSSYDCRADHELVIAGANIARFAEQIGFTDTGKAARLKASLSGYKRSLNRERFVSRVERLLPGGEADVFDCEVPGINAFDANGLYVHNCGEQPLPPYGACLLGSINLAALVKEPFTDGAHIDGDELAELVRVAVRAMDNVIDVSRFPLAEQRHEAQAKRRIGLGVTGLADALIMCRARYGSGASIELIRTWMKALSRAAYLASVEIAKEKGPFPLFVADAYLAGETVAGLDRDVREAIAEHGIRNALVTSIAPTGTISLFAGNVSSGIEPVFAYAYTRKVLMPDGTRREEKVRDFAVERYRETFGAEAALPDYFVNAQELTPAEHIAVQAAVQDFIDSSISKTINVPAEISFEDFKSVYMDAYEKGLKGCTTYRPSEVRGSVLSVDKAPANEQPALPLAAPASHDIYEKDGVVYMSKPLERETVLPGFTYKLQWPESDHAIYITINDIVQAEGQSHRRRPFEIFINSKNMEHYAWTVALTRMISAVFRRGGDVTFVVEELKAVFDPRGGSWMKGRYVPSLLAAIGEVIEQHMIDTGFIAGKNEKPLTEALRAVAGDPPSQGNPAVTSLKGCPRCGERGMVKQEGCETCTSCGYSKCS